MSTAMSNKDKKFLTWMAAVIVAVAFIVTSLGVWWDWPAKALAEENARQNEQSSQAKSASEISFAAERSSEVVAAKAMLGEMKEIAKGRTKPINNNQEGRREVAPNKPVRVSVDCSRLTFSIEKSK